MFNPDTHKIMTPHKMITTTPQFEDIVEWVCPYCYDKTIGGEIPSHCIRCGKGDKSWIKIIKLKDLLTFIDENKVDAMFCEDCKKLYGLCNCEWNNSCDHRKEVKFVEAVPVSVFGIKGETDDKKIRLYKSPATGNTYHVIEYVDLGNGKIKATQKHEVGKCTECLTKRGEKG